MNTDEELIREAQAGNRQAETEIVLRYEKLVRNLAGKYGRSHDEDVLQEGRMAVVRCARKFDPDWSVKFLTYAYNGIRGAICESLNTKFVIKIHRKAFKRGVRPIATRSFKQSDAFGATDNRDLDELLDSLTDIEREIILLRRQGYTFREIAAKVKLSNTYVSVLTDRAISKMRQLARLCG